MRTQLSEKSQKIIKYRKENPCLTLTVIADKFELSRERIRQIVDRAGVKTRHIRKQTDICPECGEHKSFEAILCWECFKRNHNVTLQCFVCEKVFKRHQSDVIKRANTTGQVHFFCSKHCFGVWFGKNNIGKKHKTETKIDA
jgi:hypothetical protein